MNHRALGMLLIGLSLLTGVIVYSIGELITAIKMSAAHVSSSISGADGPGIGWGGNPVLTTGPIIAIACCMILGFVITKRK
ncbi:hypothetical protein LC065_12900 [Halobacillus litoralis]|uniref:hypothetical protein n=1 Tax=Halobacillus litoralis TaxID=45668 RepID=UPI001CFC8528|nr:hypothetical protein [Halobacillus litoralis]WLR46469.1 hypothetical protein LC065_12900 [Halobacillus litoralis]